MNNYLNYFLEANVSLALFLGAYLAILQRETDFKVQRLFLLLGILVSLTFPLLHIQLGGAAVPSLSHVLPKFFLPEISVAADQSNPNAQAVLDIGNLWTYLQVFYIFGLLFFLCRFVMRIADLMMLFKKSRKVSSGKLKIIEFEDIDATFSFFHVIVLGRAKSLSPEEKQKVLHHEAIHAHRLHSFDILLVNLLSIFFWFNPLLRMYKKTFVQLHEFEADARAVENRDVNEYCNLLAKVALESAGFKLANYFNNSLTIKRIEMMRTIKRKIKPWKMILAAGVIPLAFIIIACQDQLADQVTEITNSSTMAVDVPPEVQETYDELVKSHPDKKYLLMETDETMEPKLAETKSLFEKIDQSQISHIQLITPTAKGSEPIRTFAIVEYNKFMEKITERSNLADDVYTVVEETSMPEGGIGSFFEHVKREIRYPAQARRLGIEGRVFVTFIVNTDGSFEVTEVSGIGGGCDLEAVRVVQTGPKWIPGKNKGVTVRQKMTLPITFELDDTSLPAKRTNQPEALKESLEEVVVVSHK